MSATSINPRVAAVRRLYGALNLALFMVSVLVIGVVLNYFSLQPAWRWQTDATKTRAYSLSEQTLQMLEGLEGEWRIALLMTGHDVEPALQRQIDEVLRRFAQTAPDLEVLRIDPADPAALRDYDALLVELQGIYAELVDEYEIALDEGERAYIALHQFARAQSGPLQQLLAFIPRVQAETHQLAIRAEYMNILANEADQALAAIRQLRQSSDVQPIPDYEGARSVLYTALWEWSNQCDDLALIFDELRETTGLEPEVGRYLGDARTAFESMAQRLITAADPLGRLEPLELAFIGQQIRDGECALVIGPDGAAAIRSEQLFPRTNVRATADAAVTFDQRFRGEQLIASTIRSMMRDHMPLVVFVHAGEQSMFIAGDNQVDLAGVKRVLATAQFEVLQWPVMQTSIPPDGAPGQPVVWVVVPPTQRPSTLEVTEGERKLIDAVETLIAEGESVMLNLYPNPLVRFGQPDPWQDLVAGLGLTVDSARAIFEAHRIGGGQTLIEQGQTIKDYVPGHAVADAVQELPAFFGLPMPIGFDGNGDTNATYDVIVRVEPNAMRWLEVDWHLGARGLDGIDAAGQFDEPIPIAVLVQRPHPVERRQQRCMLVSSGGWMLTYIADRVYSVGGNRIALEYPGNYELMLASVAWLANMDSLIAPSPMSQEVARLHDVTPADRRWWLWLTMAGLPGACIALGLVTWVVRRF